MAVEYSEIMAGAAMFYTTKELDAYSKDADSLLLWLRDAYTTISSPQNVVYGANENQFRDYVDQGRWARLQRLSEAKKKEYLTNAPKINLDENMVPGSNQQSCVQSWDNQHCIQGLQSSGPQGYSNDREYSNL